MTQSDTMPANEALQQTAASMLVSRSLQPERAVRRC